MGWDPPRGTSLDLFLLDNVVDAQLHRRLLSILYFAGPQLGDVDARHAQKFPRCIKDIYHVN